MSEAPWGIASMLPPAMPLKQKLVSTFANREKIVFKVIEDLGVEKDLPGMGHGCLPAAV